MPDYFVQQEARFNSLVGRVEAVQNAHTSDAARSRAAARLIALVSGHEADGLEVDGEAQPFPDRHCAIRDLVSDRVLTASNMLRGDDVALLDMLVEAERDLGISAPEPA